MLTTINPTILSSLTGVGDALTLDMLIVILVTLLPVIAAIIMAKKYNVIHGIISFIFFSYVLFFLSKEFNVFQYIMVGTDSISDSLIKIQDVFYLPYLLVVGGITKIPGATTVFEGEYGSYILLTGFALFFIICQVFATARNSKKLF